MWKKVAKYTGIVLLLVILGTGVYAGYLYSKADAMLDNMAVNNGGDSSSDEKPKPKPANLKPMTILLAGIDHREKTGSMNSDVLMAISLNPKMKSATVVSIPRDLELSPEGLSNRKANYYFPHFYLKDKDTAFAKTKEVFEDVVDLPMDHMVTIDFEGFEEIVDELGGLTIDVDMDMRYVDTWDGTNIDLKQGVQHLNGKETLDFVRYRKSNRGTEPSTDGERNERQQQVLGKLLDKMASVDGVAKFGSMMDIMGKHVKTDLSSGQLKDFIQTYMGVHKEDINFVHLEGDWVSPYIVVKPEDLDAAHDALDYELTKTPESEAAAAAEAAKQAALKTETQSNITDTTDVD
ncbi:LCP family protein [Paenibacillus swuensis]|uniref:LCP family protein n=1 Tax=Paenibacillus swuensis TaxID=1178515 RepID=UPI000837EEC0|nr:LCP family protein [Paenibacillus swuensis]